MLNYKEFIHFLMIRAGHSNIHPDKILEIESQSLD